MNNENKKIFHPKTTITAPARSGKGVSCAIPTVLNFPDTIIVLDFKGENFHNCPLNNMTKQEIIDRIKMKSVIRGH